MSKALLTLLVALVCSVAVAQAPTNLVQNAGFEVVQAEAPAQWTLAGAAGLDNAQFYSGAMGLVFRHPQTATSTARQTVQAAPGEYLAWVWVRTEKVVGTGARLRVLSGERVLVEANPATGDNAWRQVMVPFKVEQAGPVTVELSLEKASGTAWFDDVMMGAKSSLLLLLAAQDGPQRDNMALGKPYELSPPPSYELCTDPEDTVQLTDGKYTQGYFWTQKSTVGWYLYSPQIVVDLGKVEPIEGIMINSPGGGQAGVMFPKEITYLVSDDNVAYHEVARLTPKGLKQDGKGWYTHKFLADGLKTRGRYVMIQINKEGSTFFADEVEVYRGKHDPAAVKFTTPALNRMEMAFAQYQLKPETYTRGNFPETPHIKWLTPLSGGPVKAIMLCYSDDMRDVCEVAQRLDLDYVPVSHYSYYRPEPLGTLMQEQIATALPQSNVMVVGGLRWEAMPKALVEKIQARVREGMGLVIVASAPQFMQAVAPMWAEQPLEGDQGILDTVPMAAIPGYVKPRKGHFHLAQYGKGRIAWVNPSEFGRPAHSITCDFTLADLDEDANTPLEYSYVWLSKLMLWAAQRDLPKVKLEQTADKVVVTVPGIAGGGSVVVTGRNAEFDPEYFISGGALMRAEVPPEGLVREVRLPKGENGPQYLDVRVRAEGGIVDVASVMYKIDMGARVDSVTLSKPVYAPGEAVEAAVKLSGELAGTSLQARLVDTLGREIAAPVTVSVTGEDVALKVTPGRPLTLCANLHLTLLRGKDVLERRLERVWLDRPEDDDYTFMAWYSWETQPDAFYADKLLRTFGLDGYVSLPGKWRAENAAYGNLRHGPENVSRVAPENKDVSRVRVPCLTDPAFRAKTAERIEKMATETRPYGVTEWSLGDESTLGRRDYCTSPTCLAAFRDYLTRQYRTLAALNASWGTNFGSWEEVVPATLAEVEKKPNVGAWLDHRRYMEWLFTEYHDWCKGLILKHIPAARVGISGTPGVNSYSGHDWWQLMQGPLTHLSSYGGVQREMQRSFARPGTFVSAFLGYDYKDTDEQRARYGPWDLVFHGSNGVNYYTLMSNTLNCPLIRPDMSMTDKAKWTFDEIKELKDGMGRQFMAAKYADDGIAVHYSPASVHAATAMGLFDNRDRLRRYDNNLSNLNNILKQLHLQYDFIHEDQMARGDLANYRVLILPWSSAVSPREAEAIRKFVQAGGTVIADSYCGVRDGHGAPTAMLEDVFGLKQTLTAPELQAKELTLQGTEVANAPRTVLVASGSQELQLTTGKALGKIGEMPAVIVNKVGSGTAIFLNCSFSNYGETSLGGVGGEVVEEEQAAEAVTVPIRRLMSALLAQQGVEEPVNVAAQGEAGAQLEVSRLALGQGMLIGVVRDITEGAVDGKDALAGTLTLSKPAHVYEARSGKYLGQVKEIKDSFLRGVAKVYAVLPYRVTGLKVTAPKAAVVGQAVSLPVSLTAEGQAKFVPHVLHVTVVGPEQNGKPRDHYAQNVITSDGKATINVPLAYNDPAGRWNVRVTDVLTGTKADCPVEVAGR